MKKLANRGLAMLMAFVMIFSLMPVMEHTAHAATVNYVYSTDGNNYIYNWGTRGTVATFLSPNAENFYTGDYTYEKLSALTGSTDIDKVPESALYDALKELMTSKHTTKTTYNGTRTLYQYTDCEESNKTTLSCFYTGNNYNSAWNNGDIWNREHVWPKSKNNTETPDSAENYAEDESDIIYLRATNSTANSTRNNSAYSTVTVKDTSFYPNEYYTDGKYDIRGDAARALLYVYVRWDGYQDYLVGTDGAIESLDMLLNWMAADPVDTWELGRNDSVQSITGTRNIFVDYPELAFKLFGAEVSTTLVTPSGAAAGSHTHSFTPNVTTAASCETHGLRTYTCSCNATYTEVIFATGHNYVSGTCTNAGCGAAEPVTYNWNKVALGSIAPTDTIVITMTKDSDTWALSNAQGTGAAPTAIVVNPDGTTMTTEIKDNISWNIVSDASGYVIYKAGSTSDLLYSTATNNGIRVGSHANKYWTLDSATGYLKSTATSRYLGVYVTKPDWRCYTSTTTNIASQTLSFWKLNDGSDEGGETCAHSYASSVTTEPTCSTAGVRTYTCSLCSDSYTESIPATGNHTYVNDVCTGCGKNATVWTKVELSSITASDAVAITMTKGSDTWALSNANGTGSAPSAVVVTVNGDYMTSEELDKISWNITSGASGYTLYKGGSTTEYLYCTNANNGARVGNTSSSASSMYWELDSDYLKNVNQARYLGVYNSADWRTYTSCTGSSNIAGQTLAFWKLGRIEGGGEGGEGEVCSHVYGDPVITAATCTADGKKVFTCTNGDCGYSYEEAIPATGHSFADGACTNAGCDATQSTATLVTNVADLKAGDQIIIAAANSDFAMSTNQKSSNRGQAPITKNGDSITYISTDGVQIITLVPGTADGTFAFNVGEGYLFAASGSSNHLKTDSALTDSASWIITITDGTTSVVAKDSSVRNVMQHNSNNSLFSCYASASQAPVAIYKIGSGDGDVCSHVYGDPVITEATCTTAGKKVFTCTVDGCGYSYEETIPATGHNFVDGVCTNAGCGAEETTGTTVMIYYPAGELYVTSTASGKKLAAGTEAEAAKWTMSANESGYYSFIVNGKYMTSAETGNGLSLADTLTDCGLWEVTECDGGCYLRNVGANYDGKYNQYLEYYSGFTTYGFNDSKADIYTFQLKTVSGGESGGEGGESGGESDVCTHVYGDPVVTEATCTTAGKKVFTCTNDGCGYSYEETIRATGHSYTSTVTTEPTCTTTGVRTYVCSTCSHTYTQTIRTTEHNYLSGICTDCGYIYTAPPAIVVPEQTITVPVTDHQNTVQVQVTVTGNKASVKDTALNQIRGTETVTIDFSKLTGEISTVELPAEMLEKVGNSMQNMEIVLSNDMSIEFNAAALSKQVENANGATLNISIVPHKEAVLTQAQKDTVGNGIAYDISMTSGGTRISDMGGQITVSAPYELKNGEKASGLVVYYVDENGNRERCATYYDAETKSVKWNTNHLSLYMLDYDENRTEACDGSATCPVHAFSDAKTDAWYHNGVHYCLANGLMDGIPGNLFDPNGTTTRAQLVTILWRLEGKPVVNYLMQFDDVASDSWYTEAVRWAAAEKIVEGHDGKFDPNGAITREQLATILYRYEQYKGGGFTGTWMFLLDCTDRDKVSNWAYEAMCWMSMNGVITGTDGALNPKNNATRAQIAMTLYRYCEATGKED